MSDETQLNQLNQLTLFVEASHAKTSALPENGRALLESGPDFGSSLLELLRNLSRDGLLSKTCPAYYPPIEGQTLPLSFKGWSSAGMAWPGGYLTLNTSELPNAAAVCSLSQVLETDAPQKYYLSARACAGILRRAEKRGKELPMQLRRALEKMAAQRTTTLTKGD